MLDCANKLARLQFVADHVSIDEAQTKLFQFRGDPTTHYLHAQGQFPVTVAITDFHADMINSFHGNKSTDISHIPLQPHAKKGDVFANALKVNSRNAKTVIANGNSTEKTNEWMLILNMRKAVADGFKKSFTKSSIENKLGLENSKNSWVAIKSVEQFVKLMQILIVPTTSESAISNPFEIFARDEGNPNEFTWKLKREGSFPTIEEIENCLVIINYKMIVVFECNANDTITSIYATNRTPQSKRNTF